LKQLVGLLVCALALLAGLTTSSWGAVISVSPGQSVQAAINIATPFTDEVVVEAGTYFETLVLIDGVDLRAATPGTVFIDAEAEDTVVKAHQIGSSTTIEGICFRNGSAEEGGGLQAIGSTATFRNCVFESNGAAIGGGAFLEQGSAIRFEDCTFQRNTATVGGGMHLDFSAASINRSFFLGNECSNDGAALSIQNASEATLEDICIFDNHALAGAIISVIYSSPTLTHCTITANQEDAGLGALVMRGSGARIDMSIVAFNDGPAMKCIQSDFVVVGCNDFYGNGDDTICGDDQGDNMSADPLFCDPTQLVFKVQSNSPVLGTACGDLGAHISTCPAITTVEPSSWSAIKLYYRN
jgi:hypothetical protein